MRYGSPHDRVAYSADPEYVAQGFRPALTRTPDEQRGSATA